MKPCLDCHRLSAGSRCPTCTSARAAQRDAQRGSSAQRHYDYAHRQRRTQLLPRALGQPCPRCGEPMTDPARMDAGHSTDLAYDPTSVADHMLCSRCNRSDGATVRRAR